MYCNWEREWVCVCVCDILSKDGASHMNARVTYRTAEQSKKMVAEWLPLKQCKIILKCYWKFENVCEVQGQWWREFATEPPTQQLHIHDRFEADGTVHDVHKPRSGRPCTAMNPTSSAMVLEQFIWSPQKSTNQCALVTGISRSSVQCILKRVNGNFTSQGCYMPWIKMILIKECSFMSSFNTS
jgi:hypothetical protein